MIFIRNFMILTLHITANDDWVHDRPFIFSIVNSHQLIQLLCFRHDLFSLKEVKVQQFWLSKLFCLIKLRHIYITHKLKSKG